MPRQSERVQLLQRVSPNAGDIPSPIRPCSLTGTGDHRGVELDDGVSVLLAPAPEDNNGDWVFLTRAADRIQSSADFDVFRKAMLSL